MKNRWAFKAVKSTGLLAIGFLVGVIFGFREGQLAFYIVDSVPKATIAMSSLIQLEKGNEEPIRTFLKFDINQGLYHYSLAEDEWWFQLYKMGLIPGYSFNSELIKKLVDYKRQNPQSNEDPSLFDKVPAGNEEYANEYLDLAKSHKDRLNRIQFVIERYSKN